MEGFRSHTLYNTPSSVETHEFTLTDTLYTACLQGDEQARMLVYKALHKGVYNCCLRIVNDPDDAMDLMHDAFLEAFVKFGQYKRIGSLGGWIRRIAVNKSIDFIKRNRLTIPFEYTEKDDCSIEQEPSLELIDYKVDEIKKAIVRLNEEYRIILSLHLLEDINYNDIAILLGISYNNARTRFSRARKKLLETLSESRIFELFSN